MTITTIGLDADDTLWHNETHFRLTHDRFADLMSPWCDASLLDAELAATERRNLSIYGYGVKGFTLSMLETAMDLSEGQVSTSVVRDILAAGRDLMSHPVEPLSGVIEALVALSDRYRLVLITKGDLFHQESKLAASGLADFFSAVEIVSEKTSDTYRRIFERHGTGSQAGLMAGNSVRSDVIPAIEAGAFGVLVPYPLVWSHEAAEVPVQAERFREIETLSELPKLVDELSGR
jgi:putative hydrolase of the HAD superfamily